MERFELLCPGDSLGLISPQMCTEWPPQRRLEADCEFKTCICWGWITDDTDPPTRITKWGTHSSFLVPNAPIGAPPEDGHSWRWGIVYTRDEHGSLSECTCGIYAVAKPKQCRTYFDADCILVKVALWGEVVLAAQGARGQYAYPLELHVPEALMPYAPRLSEAYGVPHFPMQRSLWGRSEPPSELVAQAQRRRDAQAAARFFAVATFAFVALTWFLTLRHAGFWSLASGIPALLCSLLCLAAATDSGKCG